MARQRRRGRVPCREEPIGGGSEGRTIVPVPGNRGPEFCAGFPRQRRSRRDSGTRTLEETTSTAIDLGNIVRWQRPLTPPGAFRPLLPSVNYFKAGLIRASPCSRSPLRGALRASRFASRIGRTSRSHPFLHPQKHKSPNWGFCVFGGEGVRAPDMLHCPLIARFPAILSQ